MKNLIVLCAVLILLMVFPLQYALNTKNHCIISITQKHVHNGKERARQIGYFSDENIQTIRKNIARDSHLKLEDIKIVATGIENRQKRGNHIHYKVTIPLHKIIAASEMWGIDKANNRGTYTLENDAPSEWLAP